MEWLFWLLTLFPSPQPRQVTPGPILVPGWDVTLKVPAPPRQERDLMTVTYPARVRL